MCNGAGNEFFIAVSVANKRNVFSHRHTYEFVMESRALGTSHSGINHNHKLAATPPLISLLGMVAPLYTPSVPSISVHAQ